ncbi:head-tail connector protein [Actinoplanes awajinensis]|uniref:Phage gp6-like head-tail connector protein n=1 Tax=Actinoplanes awajinensis subsp. mycoplanecinus TaxID=135947 RepID=A0A101J8W6_9ACTN|nr:phage gp6-like head-tail connector protein [Actinoplanes awajinensis]KUL22352.1 hypothetical protein ADL15_48330 [Actinoplanes awajinensis subsp. mycoplanecinus]
MAWKPDYITLAQLKHYLNITHANGDAELAIHVTTASRCVDNYTHRQFGVVDAPAVREVEGVWDRRLGSHVYEIPDLATAPVEVLDESALAVTGTSLYPRNAVAEGRVWTELRSPRGGVLTIEALWGWPAVPTEVVNAALLQAARLAKRRDSPFGIAGSPSQGTEIKMLGASLDPDLRTAVAGLRRERWAV